MRNAKAVTALFGSMLLAITLTAGMAVAQSGSADSPKDSTSQPAQPAQPSQPAQSSQPSAPAQAAPDVKQSDTRTDVRSESRSEKVIVETERAKMFEPFGMMLARWAGLSMAALQRVMRAIGGAVSAESADSGGTVYRLAFPAA